MANAHIAKARIALGHKENRKGASFQGKKRMGDYTVTAFIQADDRGNPVVGESKDGTPLVFATLHFFDNKKAPKGPFG